ncbi:cupin domain-containing protein [Paraburkholderia sp. USG1]|uniref:cupin domain-containing protein n=1 Tax=Paraburkholderia sp. USG1 TaxID=2952268 RepID=UPI00285DCFBD|nr:cupin domain-containing protein [Paraburkholderia sp. USG1]MDR8402153.1 cupin domain-containing protein [Paraburkholderia sp. USG1]
MPPIAFNSLAGDLVATWKSSVVGEVGPARIKVLRMDGQPYGEKTDDYNEALMVISGELRLPVDGNTINVRSGQMYLAEAGVAHAVFPGSTGTLAIIDI